MGTPTISIVVPVYNAQQHLPHTLDSLLRQSSRDFEVLFVDDGSPDDSGELICRTLQDTDLNWRLIRQENQGQGGARNTGFFEASGGWILFLDADDTLQHYTVETYCRLAQQYPDADVIFSQYCNVDSENAGKQVWEDPRNAPTTREALLNGFLTRTMVFLVPGTLYRRDFLRRTETVHTRIPWSEDQYFMWQVLSRLEKAVISQAVIYNYVHHNGPSIMRSTPLDKMLTAYDQFCGLPEEMSDPVVKKHLLPRWCLGCLHIFASRCDRTSFDAFWKATDFTAKCKTLLSFPSRKIRILAAIGLACKPLLFRVMR